MPNILKKIVSKLRYLLNKVLYPAQVTFIKAFQKPQYHIKRGYIHRTKNYHFDATPRTDDWQKEVYLKAKSLAESHQLNSVLDFGCGSGFKLVHYLGEYNTIGIELSPTYEFLMDKYPEREWLNFNDSENAKLEAELVICADVIEHVPDPDDLIRRLKQIQGVKYLLISTPDRSLIHTKPYGPPYNKTHMREWTFEEFGSYMKQHFNIEEHYLSNKKQATQLIIVSF